MEAWSSSTVPLQPLPMLGDTTRCCRLRHPPHRSPLTFFPPRKQTTFALAFPEKCIIVQGDLLWCWRPGMSPQRVSLLLLLPQLCHPTGSLWQSRSLSWLCSQRRDGIPGEP